MSNSRGKSHSVDNSSPVSIASDPVKGRKSARTSDTLTEVPSRGASRPTQASPIEGPRLTDSHSTEDPSALTPTLGARLAATQASNQKDTRAHNPLLSGNTNGQDPIGGAPPPVAQSTSTATQACTERALTPPLPHPSGAEPEPSAIAHVPCIQDDEVDYLSDTPLSAIAQNVPRLADGTVAPHSTATAPHVPGSPPRDVSTHNSSASDVNTVSDSQQAGATLSSGSPASHAHATIVLDPEQTGQEIRLSFKIQTPVKADPNKTPDGSPDKGIHQKPPTSSDAHDANQSPHSGTASLGPRTIARTPLDLPPSEVPQNTWSNVSSNVAKSHDAPSDLASSDASRLQGTVGLSASLATAACPSAPAVSPLSTPLNSDDNPRTGLPISTMPGPENDSSHISVGNSTVALNPQSININISNGVSTSMGAPAATHASSQASLAPVATPDGSLADGIHLHASPKQVPTPALTSSTMTAPIPGFSPREIAFMRALPTALANITECQDAVRFMASDNNCPDNLDNSMLTDLVAARASFIFLSASPLLTTVDSRMKCDEPTRAVVYSIIKSNNNLIFGPPIAGQPSSLADRTDCLVCQASEIIASAPPLDESLAAQLNDALDLKAPEFQNVKWGDRSSSSPPDPPADIPQPLVRLSPSPSPHQRPALGAASGTTLHNPNSDPPHEAWQTCALDMLATPPQLDPCTIKDLDYSLLSRSICLEQRIDLCLSSISSREVASKYVELKTSLEFEPEHLRFKVVQSYDVPAPCGYGNTSKALLFAYADHSIRDTVLGNFARRSFDSFPPDWERGNYKRISAFRDTELGIRPSTHIHIPRLDRDTTATIFAIFPAELYETRCVERAAYRAGFPDSPSRALIPIPPRLQPNSVPMPTPRVRSPKDILNEFFRDNPVNITIFPPENALAWQYWSKVSNKGAMLRPTLLMGATQYPGCYAPPPDSHRFGITGGAHFAFSPPNPLEPAFFPTSAIGAPLIIRAFDELPFSHDSVPASVAQGGDSAIDARQVSNEHSRALRIRLKGSPRELKPVLDQHPVGIRNGEFIPNNIDVSEWIKESRELEPSRRHLLDTCTSIEFHPYYTSDPEHPFYKGPPPITHITEAAISAGTRLLPFLTISFPKIVKSESGETVTNLTIYPAHQQGTTSVRISTPYHSRPTPPPGARRQQRYDSRDHMSSTRQPNFPPRNQHNHRGRNDQQRRTSDPPLPRNRDREHHAHPYPFADGGTIDDQLVDAAMSALDPEPVRSDANARFNRPPREPEGIYDLMQD